MAKRWISKSDYFQGRSQVTRDIIAGITVGVVALPLAIGFGITSGMSAQAGITTAILAGFIAAVFGGSRFQVSGPTGAMTVVLIPVINKYGVGAVPVLGLIAGAIVIAMSLLRLGSLINRIPWSVVEGFTLGIAIVIGLQQLPMALGVAKGAGDRTLLIAIHTVQNAYHSGIAWPTLFVLLITLFIKFNIVKILEALRIKPYIPASFIALAVTTFLAQVMHLKVATIGDIPRNIFHLSSSQLNFSYHLLLPALLIAILAAVESLLSARVADGMAHSKEHFQPNRELFGQGLATAVASLFGGQPATGAIARTGVNVRSGAQTRTAAVVHSIFLLIVVMLLSPIFSLIPLPAIAGVLIGTSVRILNPRNIREQLTSTWQEVLTFLATAIITVAVDLIWAIGVGIALHLLLQFTKKKQG